MKKTDYCKDFLIYRRRNSSMVKVGNIPMGGNFPIRIQSMTNTDTSDVKASVDQIIRIAGEGADFVRLTVPGQKDVESLAAIKGELEQQGISVPLVADIHFNARLAHIAATIVNKVRVNPGNFTDKKRSDKEPIIDEISDLQKLRSEFLQLLEICKKHNTSLRIGTNHGSLSDRIMDKYGDTVDGMVESAMEFLRICKEVNFSNVVISMKSSNTRVMVYATRLLVSKMDEEGMNFPLHLGVTEAGEGEDGRIKSAVGIGTLLADGIGDTIRVSLTEDPEKEIPVAGKLVNFYKERENHSEIPGFDFYPLSPFEYKRRETFHVNDIGGSNIPVVISRIKGDITKEKLLQIGWTYLSDGSWIFSDTAPDYLIADHWPQELTPPEAKHIIFTFDNFSLKSGNALLDYSVFEKIKAKEEITYFVTIKASQLLYPIIEFMANYSNVVLIIETDHCNGYADQRAAVIRLINRNCKLPVLFKRNFNDSLLEDFQLKSAADLGGLFIDGLGDGIWIEDNNLSDRDIINTAFGILQASRVRISKTEYISCPSCGRTLFDLQATTKKIRECTNHLKGLKIGIMGCIVNGPGEMADADYGYVGTGKGKVTLYKEKQVIKRNVSEENAVDELIRLIKENGDWVEP